jgi:hypothetical protein
MFLIGNKLMSSAPNEEGLAPGVVSALIALGRDTHIESVIEALKVHGDRPEVIKALLDGAAYWNRDSDRYKIEIKTIHGGISTYRERTVDTPSSSALEKILNEIQAMRYEITSLRAIVLDLAGLTAPTDLSKKIRKNEPPLPPPT